MWRAPMAAALIVLSCATSMPGERESKDARLLEAQEAFEEGKRLSNAGQYVKAVLPSERALALREAVLGGAHPEVASCLHLLGAISMRQGSYTRAEPILQRALAIREAALGKGHPQVADSLNVLAVLYAKQGLSARAEPLYQRALEIRESALGKNHPDVAVSLDNLANLYANQGLSARAEPLYQRALAIAEAALGRNHPDVARMSSNLAILYQEQGLYAQAELLHERTLEIQEATLGKTHPDVANSLNALAALYTHQGFYARAEPLYQRSLAIAEAALGKNHPDVARFINNLAILYREQGLYAQAELLYERTLEIREAALGKTHPDVGNSLTSLATLYAHQGFHARAEPLYQRALSIWEAAFGEKHPYVAGSLTNLGLLHAKQGLYSQAEPLFQRALSIWEATLKNHPNVALSLHSLATLYTEQGQYARAEPLYERALSIREAALGKAHPHVAQSLSALAQLRLAQQRLAEALSFFERALTASEEHLRQEVFGYSEARLASVLHLLRAEEERLYALARAHPSDARVQRLALSTALLRKGRSLEEIANTSRIIYRDLGQADRLTFERLRALRTQLSTRALAGPGPLSPTDFQQSLKELADQADALEADLARRSAPLRALRELPPPTELIDRVAATLPKEGVLVEFVAYRDSPVVPKPGTPPAQLPSEPRYLALLLFADGRTRALDLGPAERIDHAALRLHHALADQSTSYQPAAQALYNLAFRPLVPLLGKVQRLFLSPDGQLALAPFAALHDGKRFLMDAWDMTYLTSGKELLTRSKDIPVAHSVVVMADPDLGSSLAAPLSAPQVSPVPPERSTSLDLLFSTLREEIADQPLPPLPGARLEAEAIQRLFPQAQLLLGQAATKDALLKLATPGILHIATHGFFREDASTPRGTRAVGYFGAVGDAGPQQLSADPLLRSGLVLAGAQARTAQSNAQSGRNSFVTALELAGLNLWGTQLVVLSACDTGRGAVKHGQGVYGLRRALVVAGAQAVVTSLWKVNDETTRQLMESYYKYLLAGQGRTSALCEAMRALRLKQPHPHFWAPFVAIGPDTPLQGLTPSPERRPAP